MMGVWNARLLDDSLHKALYGRGKALYQSTHHYKDFGLLVGADVKITLEIEAEIPGNVPDNVIRTVTENSRTLNFEDSGFESE